MLRFNLFLLIIITTLFASPVKAAEPGITDIQIILGSVLPTKGRSKLLGKGMMKGLQASLDQQQVDGKVVSIQFENDLYESWMSEKS